MRRCVLTGQVSFPAEVTTEGNEQEAFVRDLEHVCLLVLLNDWIRINSRFDYVTPRRVHSVRKLQNLGAVYVEFGGIHTITTYILKENLRILYTVIKTYRPATTRFSE